MNGYRARLSNSRASRPAAFGPGLGCNHLLPHGSPSAREQARALIPRYEGRPAAALVFGLGLGWHLLALREQWPEIELTVFEPAADLREPFANKSPAVKMVAGNLKLLADWPEFERRAAALAVYGSGPPPLFMVAPGYEELFPEAARAFKNLSQRSRLRRAVIDQTRWAVEDKYLANLAQNIGQIIRLPDLGGRPGRLARAGAAFLVGSGPSLDQNGRFLTAARNKGLIIAAASALKPLLAMGVRPQVVLAIEASDTSGFLALSAGEAAFLGPDVLLALASGVHPAHFQAACFNKAVMHLHPGEAGLFGQGRFIPQGGNCGTAAFALACHWGLAPLILVGQDQALLHNRQYAAGTPGQSCPPAADLEVVGLNGGPARTHSGWWASLDWYGEAAESLKARPNSPALYNAAASGARVPGFPAAPLDRLIAGLPDSPLKEPGNLARCLGRPPAPAEEVAQDLAQLAALVTSLAKLHQIAPQKAAEAVRKACGLSPFLTRLLGRFWAATSSELGRALAKALDLLNRIKLGLGA